MRQAISFIYNLQGKMRMMRVKFKDLRSLKINYNVYLICTLIQTIHTHPPLTTHIHVVAIHIYVDV